MENPFYINESAHFKSFDYYNEKVSIQEMKQLKVIKEKHIGNYVKIGESWDKFIEKYKDYINEDTLLIEKSYNDPSISKVNECVYDLCITVDKDVNHENLTIIEGNKYAVYRFDNFISEIIYEFSGLFSKWLPNSSYERSDEKEESNEEIANEVVYGKDGQGKNESNAVWVNATMKRLENNFDKATVKKGMIAGIYPDIIKKLVLIAPAA